MKRKDFISNLRRDGIAKPVATAMANINKRRNKPYLETYCTAYLSGLLAMGAITSNQAKEYAAVLNGLDPHYRLCLINNGGLHEALNITKGEKP